MNGRWYCRGLVLVLGRILVAPSTSSEQQAAWAGYMHRLAAADTGPVPAISTPQGDRGYYAQGDTSGVANIIQGDPQISLTGWQSIICK